MEYRLHEVRILGWNQGGMVVHEPNLGPPPRQLGLIFAHQPNPSRNHVTNRSNFGFTG